MQYDESIEVIETGRPESAQRISSGFGRDSNNSSFSRESNSQFLRNSQGQFSGRDSMEDEIEGAVDNNRRQSTSIGELKRPTTAGRPGTAGGGGRPSTAGRPVSVRLRPPSPEPSEAGVSEDEEDEDEMNSTQVEGSDLVGGILSEFDSEEEEDDLNSAYFDPDEIQEFHFDTSNLCGIYDQPDDDLDDLLSAIPENPEFFIPTYLSDSNDPEDEDSVHNVANKRWKEIILEKKREIAKKHALLSDNPGIHRAGKRVYNPADYENLTVSDEIKELFGYITKYSTSSGPFRLEVKLRPFIPEYSPSVGDIDAFIKVTHDDVKKDGLGIKVLDEPSAFQSDPSVLDLRLRALAKQSSAKAVVVKKVENVSKNAKIIENWIKDISDLHRTKPSPSVHYSKPMPDIDNLLQEWPPEFEELLKTITLPSANMECDLATYVDLICNLMDIPVYKSRVQSLHLLATLYLTQKNYTFGMNQGNNGSGMPPQSATRRNDDVDRLEL